jgi:hypothetical protein
MVQEFHEFVSYLAVEKTVWQLVRENLPGIGQVIFIVPFLQEAVSNESIQPVFDIIT